MPDIDLLPVLLSTVVLFVLGWTYYELLAGRAHEPDADREPAPQPPPWKMAVELGRCLVLAAVVAGLASQGEIDEWTGGLLLGIALWVGFPAVLWSGAMLWENIPWRQAALHAGDWLVKLVVVGVIVSVW